MQGYHMKKETNKEKTGGKEHKPREHKTNWKEYMATVEDIQNFLMDRVRALQIVGGNMVHQISPVRLGRAFTDLGFEFKRTKSSRGYIVVQRTAAEIKSRLQLMAGDG